MYYLAMDRQLFLQFISDPPGAIERLPGIDLINAVLDIDLSGIEQIEK